MKVKRKKGVAVIVSFLSAIVVIIESQGPCLPYLRRGRFLGKVMTYWTLIQLIRRNSRVRVEDLFSCSLPLLVRPLKYVIITII